MMEMRCLRTICGVRWLDRETNNRVRRICRNKRSLGERADQGVLKWFGHLERMIDESLVKRVYKSEVRWARGRPKKKWKDGLKWSDVEYGATRRQ